jgi:hypothetical protein
MWASCSCWAVEPEWKSVFQLFKESPKSAKLLVDNPSPRFSTPEGQRVSDKPRYLSKGRFKLGSECPRKLYYEHHKDRYANQKQDDPFLRALAEGGHQVGALAQAYFPGGTLIESLDYEESLAETDRLLEQDQVIIYEPAFLVEDYFIRVDVLVKEGNHVQLIEVKAKSFDKEKGFLTKKGHPLAGQASYLDDIAFQTWVVGQARPSWRLQPYLMLINKDAVATVDGLHQLFRIKKDDRGRVDVELTEPVDGDRLGRGILMLEDMREMVDRIVAGTMCDLTKVPTYQGNPLPERARLLANIYRDGTRYPVEVGTRCRDCEYRNTPVTAAAGMACGFSECWSAKWGAAFSPDAPLVTDLWNYRGAGDLLEKGIWKMGDIPAGTLEGIHQVQFRVMTGDGPVEWRSPQLAEELAGWKYPLHFLDFETIGPAIPFHRGLRPYESEGFQFSCHHVAEDGAITHDQYIATDPGQYPSYDFLVALKNVLSGDEGTILRYSAHENTILRSLRRNLVGNRPEVPQGIDPDELIAFIDEITHGTGGEPGHIGPRDMVDMYDLVREHYYHRRMGKKKSIKAVLDAVLSTSEFLKEKYSRPLEFGTNLKGMIMHQVDPETGETRDPYKLLPPVFADVDREKIAFFEEDEKLADGGAAMTAFAKMQFTEMGEEERAATVEALLKYCELDTLAMVMVWEGFIGGNAK